MAIKDTCTSKPLSTYTQVLKDIQTNTKAPDCNIYREEASLPILALYALNYTHYNDVTLSH